MDQATYDKYMKYPTGVPTSSAAGSPISDSSPWSRAVIDALSGRRETPSAGL